jgi:hypothetical protein
MLSFLFVSLPAFAQTFAGVAASSGEDGPVLVWNETTAYRSADGSLPFERISEDEGAAVWDGAIESDGSWALIRSPDESTTFVEIGSASGAVRRVPLDGARALAMRSSVLAVRSEAAVHVSKDRGLTFETAAAPPPFAGVGPMFGTWHNDLDVTLGGDVIVSDLEINTCGSSDRLEWMRVLRVAGPALVPHDIVLAQADYAASFQIGAHGWLYGGSYADRLVAYGDGRGSPIQGLRGTADGPTLIANNGRVTLAIDGGTLAALHGRSARVLARDVPEISHLAVDGRGRALAITARGLERFRRGRGFELVVAPLP